MAVRMQMCVMFGRMKWINLIQHILSMHPGVDAAGVVLNHDSTIVPGQSLGRFCTPYSVLGSTSKRDRRWGVRCTYSTSAIGKYLRLGVCGTELKPLFPGQQACTKVSTLIVWRVVTMVTIQLLLSLGGVLLFLFIALLGHHSIVQVKQVLASMFKLFKIIF